MRPQGPGTASGSSLDDLIRTLTTSVADRLGIQAQACATATVRGLDRWLAAGSGAAAQCVSVQDILRQGPRYHAREVGTHVLVPDIAVDERWPVWSHACEVGGFRSAAVVQGTSRGVTVYLDLYAQTPMPWEDVAERAAALAGGIASAVVTREEVIALAQATDDLLGSSGSQPLIDRAVGVLMAHRRCDAAEAFGALRAASVHRDTREVAAGVVARGGVLPGHPVARTVGLAARGAA